MAVQRTSERFSVVSEDFEGRVHTTIWATQAFAERHFIAEQRTGGRKRVTLWDARDRSPHLVATWSQSSPVAIPSR